MSKKLIWGIGLLGVTAAFVYAYKKQKDKIKAEQEAETEVSNIEDQVEIIGDEDDDIDISMKPKHETVSKIMRFIGKKLGDFTINHPNIIKFTCKHIGLISLTTLCAILAAIRKKPRHPKMENQEYDSYWDNDLGIGMRITPESDFKTAEDAFSVWETSEYSDNYNKVVDFFNTLNLHYGEHYCIYEKKSTEDYLGTKCPETFVNNCLVEQNISL